MNFTAIVIAAEKKILVRLYSKTTGNLSGRGQTIHQKMSWTT